MAPNMQANQRREKKRAQRAFSPRAQNGRTVGIQWRLLGYLSLFVAFILIVLWAFQIWLLIPFYEEIKNRELEETGTHLSQFLKEDLDVAQGDIEVLQKELWSLAEEYSVCITVWKLDKGMARFMAEADISDDCIIHRVTGGDLLGRLYGSAREHGGHYACKVKFYRDGMILVDENGKTHTPAVPSEDIPSGADDRQEGGGFSALHMRLCRGADDEQYIVLLDAELTPLSATVMTLRTQFYLIAVILLLAALLLAYLMSRRISRPLVRMNEVARALAKGEYDVHFAGNGYRETRELAETLNYAARELSKIDRLQKELIANISHDLRTPLTMITGYGEVMRDLPGENTPENVQVIIDEATHLSALVNDLLDLSKLQSGARLPERKLLDLTETVREVLLRYEMLTRHDGYHITFEESGNVVVFADRMMLLQVIYNLVNNAINYCGEGKKIVVRQTIANGYVRITVSDDGAGIPQEQLPYIWDRYYKVDRVHRRAMVGTGLGLSIVKGILEVHGACYGVESVPNRGSEFWFELAIVDDKMQLPEE